MKKTIGNIEEFAIEYELDDVATNGHYYGGVVFWINSVKIGEENNFAYLSTCVSELDNFLFYKEIRLVHNSAEKTSAELFELLYMRFFGDEAKSTGAYLKLGVFREVFWLSEIGDSSIRDTAVIILVDESEQQRQRLLWRTYDELILHEHFIKYGIFEEIANGFKQSLTEDVKKFHGQ